jgi:hypothetical protein
LRFHCDRIGQLADAKLARAGKSMQKAKPGVVGKDLKEVHECGGLLTR